MVGINVLFSPTYEWTYWGYNPLILTIDPNFQRDIQVTPFQQYWLSFFQIAWNPGKRWDR